MAKNFKRFGAIVASGAAVAAAVSSPVAAVAQERVAEEAALDTPIGDTGVTPREVYETIVYAAENDAELRAQILEVEAQIMGSHIVESDNGEYYINEAALDLGGITSALGSIDVGALTSTLGNVANKVGGAVSNGDFAGAVGAITGAMNDPNIKNAADTATKIGKDLLSNGTAGEVLGAVTGTVGSLLGKDKGSAGATTNQKPAGTTGTNTTGTGSGSTAGSTGSTGGSATPGTGSTGGSATPNTGSTDTKPSTNKPAPTTTAKPADNKPKPSTSAPAPKTTENKPSEDKAADSKPAPNTTENKADSTVDKKSGEKATATSEKKVELANTERARTSVAEGKDIVSLLKDYDYSNVNAEQGDKLRKIGKRIADEVVRVEAALRGSSQDALDASVKALNDSISEYNKTVSAITAEQNGDKKGDSSDKKDSTVVVDNREGTSEEKRVVVKEGESETVVETSSRPMLASTGAPVGAVAAAATSLVAMTGFAASRRNK